MRPLPDDVRALRTLYPLGVVRHEVALFNSWFEPGSAERLPGEHELLCAPSRGQAPGDLFADHCGQGGPNGGSTVVCEGNRVVARFTIANYSTEPMDLIVRLYASLDAYHSSDDRNFPDWHLVEMEPGRATVFQLGWRARP